MARVNLYNDWGEKIASLPGLREEIDRRGEAVAEAARATAPVETGDYLESIDVQHMRSREGGWTEIFDRPISRVIADSDHAAAVEGRTRNLGRAADAAGGTV